MSPPIADGLHDVWEIESTAHHVVSRGYRRLALQFPDDLLMWAPTVAAELTATCRHKGATVDVSVLADTSYNSLGVDEVAAQHYSADCVVHYGRASLSPLRRLPAFFVFPKKPLEVPDLAARICQHLTDSVSGSGKRGLVVVLDQEYGWASGALAALMQQEAGPGIPIAVSEIAAHYLDPGSEGTPSGAAATSFKGGLASTHSDAVADSKQPQQSTEQPVPDAHDSTGDVLPQTGPCSQDCAPAVVTASLPLSQGPGCPSAADSRWREVGPPVAAGAPLIGSGIGGAAAARVASPDDGDMQHRGQGSGLGGQRMSLAGLTWQLPVGAGEADCAWLWVGPDDTAAQTQLHMTLNNAQWAGYDPASGTWREGLPARIAAGLRRRYYLVERAKNAVLVGILVGTLGVAGCLEAVAAVRRLARGAGKRTYTVLMGKPTPAKLANFPEIQLWVLIADAQGQMLDSKEFLAPIITPYEAQLAFDPQRTWTGAYSLEFDGLLGTASPTVQSSAADPASSAADEYEGAAAEPRFSLLDGAYHEQEAGAHSIADASSSQALLLRANQHLQQRAGGKLAAAEVRSASDYLTMRREYQGLEMPALGAEPKPVAKAVAGQCGRANHYDHEPVGPTRSFMMTD